MTGCAQAPSSTNAPDVLDGFARRLSVVFGDALLVRRGGVESLVGRGPVERQARLGVGRGLDGGLDAVAVLARQDDVEQDSRERSDRQARKGDGDLAGGDDDGGGGAVGDAEREDQHQRGDEHVAALHEVDVVLHQVADADGGDHAVKHQRHAADDAGGHDGDDGRELGGEREQDGEQRRDAHDARVEHAGEREHARVLAVGGVGRRAEQGGDDGRQTVAEQRAVKPRLCDEVAVARRADGRDVADVLDHRGEGQRHDGDDGRQTVAEQRAVKPRLCDEVAVARRADGRDVADVLDHRGEGQRHDGDDGGDGKPGVEPFAEQREHRVVPHHRKADPGGLRHGREIDLPHGRRSDVRADDAEQDGDDLDHAATPDVGDHDDGDGHDGDHPVRGGVLDGRGCDVRADDAEQDGDDLDHAATPDVGDHDDGDGHDGDHPVRGGVLDGRGCQDEADGDDDGAGDHRREVAHDVRRAEHAEQRREHEVQKARARDAQARVGQKFRLACRGDGGVTRDEREGRTQEGGHFALREQVEQKRSQAGEQKRRRDRQAGQRGDEYGRAEHREHVLNRQRYEQTCRHLVLNLNDLLGFHFFTSSFS